MSGNTNPNQQISAENLVADFSALSARAQAVVQALSSAAWGAITGTLSNQADLQAALDEKAPNILFAHQSALQSFESDAAFDPTELQVNLETGKSYRIVVEGNFDNGAGFLMLTFGGTSVIDASKFNAVSCAAVGTSGSPLCTVPFSATDTPAFGTDIQMKFIRITGILSVESGGTFNLQGKQFSTNVDPSTIEALAFIRAEEIPSIA